MISYAYMPHANLELFDKINRSFNLPVSNMNDLNFIFFSNKCPFFPIMQQYYTNEAFEFLQSYNYLKQLALNVKNILPDYITLLRTGDIFNKIELNRKQVALLFLLSFFDCVPQNTNSNLNSFYVSQVLIESNGPKFEFARSFLNYLTIIGKWLAENNMILEEKITFLRQSINRVTNNFENMNFINLCEVNFISQGSLFDGNAKYCVDFSNKYIGGGTLTGGCVQEEILFASQPELLVAMYFMEVMDENSAIGIFNTIQYSCFQGYGKMISFIGSNMINGYNNLKRFRIIAMDADFKDQCLNGADHQIYKEIIKRDIYKAFAGFGLINCDINDNNNMNNSMINNMSNNMNSNMMNNFNVSIDNSINTSLNNNMNNYPNNMNNINNNMDDRNNNISIATYRQQSNNTYMYNDPNNNNMNNRNNNFGINMNNFQNNNNMNHFQNNNNMNNNMNNNLINNNMVYNNMNNNNMNIINMNNNNMVNNYMNNNNMVNNNMINNNMNNDMINNNMNNNMMFNRSVATGNWGCGIYKGIPELKFIEQWIAASFAGVSRLDYYTFGKKEMEKCIKSYQFFKNNKFGDAGYLYRVLINNKLDVNNLIINLANGQFQL